MNDIFNSTDPKTSYSAVQKFSRMKRTCNSVCHVMGGVSRKGAPKIYGHFPVNIELTDSLAVVEIIGDAQFQHNYLPKYTNENCTFIFINRALIIRGKDRWGNSVEFDIT